MQWSQPAIYPFATRLLLFMAIWITLTNGENASLWIGIPAVVLVTILSIKLNPPVQWHLVAFIKFLPFYFYHALMGGVDVMMRVFHPRLPIDPDIIQYRLNLPEGIGQEMLINVLNLMPGTLSVALDNGLLYVHVLERQKHTTGEIAAIEAYIHAIFSSEGKRCTT